jgi:hypothetical protein
MTKFFFKKRAKIQGFIFNWKRHEASASALENKIGELINVTVINSEEQHRNDRPGWVHLDDSAYFSAQWNKAVELFEADIFFHIQADAEFDQFNMLIPKAGLLFEKYKLGVYEPNVDYTDIKYDTSKLLSIDTGLFEVPFTDCTCWFIDGSIVRKLPPIDISINRYGWGIPRAIASISRLNGLLCMRDYNFTVTHPKGRGYSTAAALGQVDMYIRSLNPAIRNELILLQKRRELLRSGKNFR